MKRSEKIEAVETLNRMFQDTPHVILTNFSGLTVNQSTGLRQKIRAAGGRYQVIKNRLAKRAADGTPVEQISTRFDGPCAIAGHDTDPVALAKVLADFIKDNPQIELSAGVLDGRSAIDAAEITQLSKLPGLEQLRAQLLALIQTPATTLVRLINTPGSQLARVIDARREAQDEG